MFSCNFSKTMISVPATVTYTTEANVFESNGNGGSVQDNEKDQTKRLSGFIFLCNQRTKLECYQYRVFGLPSGKKEVVEEIKRGFKLFLFDFELKLLYGVYEATSDGNLNMEPAAFGGKFPAQWKICKILSSTDRLVKFKIFKECLPIRESSLRFVIKENYTGSKFKQELSGEQVTKLISSFRPLPAAQDLGNVPRPGIMPPDSEVQYSHIQPLAEGRPVLSANYQEHGPHKRGAYVENAHPTFNYRSLPVANSYFSHPQQPLDVSSQVQDPYYSRYGTIESGSDHAQVTSFERYIMAEQRARHDEIRISGRLYQDNVASYYPNSTSTDQYTPSVLQSQPCTSYQHLPLQGRQYQDSVVAYSSNPAAPVQYTTSEYSQQVDAAYFPVQNEALHQGNATANHSNLTTIAQYASSVLQRLGHVPYDQSSLQGTEYQDNTFAYSSNLAAPAQYSTSNSQPQVEATHLPLQREAVYQDNVVPYNSEPAVPAQYTSISQPQVSATNWPLHSEGMHEVNVSVYNSDPVVTAQYNPVARPNGPYAMSEGRAPVASYDSYSAANHSIH